MSIIVIRSNLGNIPLWISPSIFALIPYEAKVDTTAFTKKTIQQLSQKPFKFKLNNWEELPFFDMNWKAEKKPSFITKGFGGNLITFFNSEIILEEFIINTC